MATKAVELQVSASIELCYDALHDTGNELKGWKTIEANKQNYTLKWKTGSIRGSPSMNITATLKPLGSKVTYISCSANHWGLADMMGLLPMALEMLLNPFQKRVAAMAVVEEVEERIQEGLICPTCGKEMRPGTRFCPNDGTPINRECPKCKHANPPGSQFCSNCGAKI